MTAEMAVGARESDRGAPRPTCCPACGSAEFAIRSPRIRFPAADAVPAADYALRECTRCGLWFKDPLPSAEALVAHYGAQPVDSSGWNHEQRYPHEATIDTMLRALPDGAPVLDVGCWTGHLLGPHATRLQAFGVEPNPAAAGRASARGHAAVFRTLPEVPSSLRFSAITMVDVFEHLLEPLATIRQLVAMLQRGGRLTIVTGRTDAIPVRIAGGSYWYFACADHLVFLNRRFARYLRGALPGTRVTYRAVRHFRVGWRTRLHEAAWLAAWRWGSPHSPFRTLPVHRLPGFRRLERLRQPMVCGGFRDHAMLSIVTPR